MEEMKRVFNKLDKNGDGMICRDELKLALSTLDSESSSDEIDKIMMEMDKDGNGYIDLDEFIAFDGIAGDENQMSSKELKDAFNLYDLDKNGLISASELHAVLKKLGEQFSLSHCQRMISKFDENGDGNVDFQEFKKMMMTNA
ncbi:PfkB-like carbohydrate kinase family protein [Hibiscus syriacus]|uniref:PfkB-like carbohydrate kinase family protein n=2 Tax=Hibiscus syriacus TaxID=106335 RepID=A0A6A3BQP9_HIBSY|nr:PfkB-like carbohydrate kinase family protein [Hibiscus syriacus]